MFVSSLWPTGLLALPAICTSGPNRAGQNPELAQKKDIYKKESTVKHRTGLPFYAAEQ